MLRPRVFHDTCINFPAQYIRDIVSNSTSILTVGLTAGSGDSAFPDVQEKQSVTSCFHGGFKWER